MDVGVAAIANAIACSTSLVTVDLSMNSLSPRCAQEIYRIISQNSSIFSLNIGSSSACQRNRIGKEGAIAIANGFMQNNSLV